MTNDRPKRKAIPLQTKKDCCEFQGYLCACGCGAPVHWRPKSQSVFDHVPALRLRDILPDHSDYSPRQHDRKYIQVLRKECSDLKTFRKDGANFSDIVQIKRERRREKERRGEGKKKRTWPKGRSLQSRPFPKVKRGFKARKPERRPERP